MRLSCEVYHLPFFRVLNSTISTASNPPPTQKIAKVHTPCLSVNLVTCNNSLDIQCLAGEYLQVFLLLYVP
jgi:hypothetical protein